MCQKLPASAEGTRLTKARVLRVMMVPPPLLGGLIAL